MKFYIDKEIMLLACILVAYGTLLGRVTSCPDLVYSWFCSVCKCKRQGSTVTGTQHADFRRGLVVAVALLEC